jgi:hypothetical protein
MSKEKHVPADSAFVTVSQLQKRFSAIFPDRH